MSKALRKIFLHIGLEKTGTTSIQEFLHTNRNALLKAGVFVPQSLGYKNHKMLAAYGFDETSTDVAVTSAEVGRSVKDVADYRAKLRENLSREIGATAADIAIVSSEDLSRFFSRAEIDRVLVLLREFCDDVTVLVFLRRQDLLASSRYYSLIIGGSPQSYVFPAPHTSRNYDYAHNLGLWCDVVGDENITAVRFPEKPSDEGFNSVSRFCALTGLDEGIYEPVASQHVSFDVVNQIIIQNFNTKTNGADQEGLTRLMARLECVNDQSHGLITSEKQARAFYASYRDPTLELLQRLGAEGQMFSDDFSMYPEENMRGRFQQIAIQRLLGMLDG